MTKTFNQSVIAVVVTYQPDIEVLDNLLKALIPQVDSLVVVDNGSDEDLSAWYSQYQIHAIGLILLGENKGIAAAHNMGIQWARDQQAEFVLLMDQDSIPVPNMVSCLASAMHRLTRQGIKVAAVGPCYQDQRYIERPTFIKVSGLKSHRFLCQPSDEIVESDIIISSGSLIPLKVLAEIGGPLNELFIDQVDMEWCFRAKAYGYTLFGVCRAVMFHSLGESTKSFLGRKFLHHSPLRHYYIFRNAVYLVFKRYVPMGWKFLFIRTIIFRCLLYICLVSPRVAYLKMMSKGIWHGLCGRMGKFEL